jgi:hypothetical protein
MHHKQQGCENRADSFFFLPLPMHTVYIYIYVCVKLKLKQELTPTAFKTPDLNCLKLSKTYHPFFVKTYHLFRQLGVSKSCKITHILWGKLLTKKGSRSYKIMSNENKI